MIGELVDWIDLSPMAPEGGLGGVAVDAAGRVYVTVMNANQVISRFGCASPPREHGSIASAR